MAGSTTLINPRASDDAVMAASNAVGSAGVANLQDQRPKLVWQSTTTTPFITINAGAAVLWNALFLGYFNGQAADTLRLRGATSEANLTAAPSYDSNTLLPGGITAWPVGSNLANYRYPHRLFLFTPGGSLQWWRVDFAWGSNTDGFVRGGRLALGLAVTPETGAAPGWEASHSEPIIETEDMDGGQTTRPRGARRSMPFSWMDAALTKAEAAQIQELLLERGSSRDLVVCLDTTELLYPMPVLYVGRVKQRVSIKQMFISYRSTGFEVEELAVTEMR
jgi:hypothetical protein